jgi:hypothetical protein
MSWFGAKNSWYVTAAVEKNQSLPFPLSGPQFPPEVVDTGMLVLSFW